MKADEASPHLKANGDIKAVHISKPSFLYYTWQLSPWHLEGLLRITIRISLPTAASAKGPA